MTKNEFINKLKKSLVGLSDEDLDCSLEYYSEIIDDAVEEGKCEEVAVSELGEVDDIATQILSETPLTKIVKEKIRKNRSLKVWEIVLLVLGSPIWLSIFIAAFAVLISLYISLWSIVVSLWSVFVSFIACAFAGVVFGAGCAISGEILPGVAMLGVALVLAGLSIFMFYICKYLTKWTALLAKWFVLGIKKCFVKGEDK